MAHEKGVNGLSFTSDGLHLVSYGADNALRLWDAFSAKNTLVSETLDYFIEMLVF